MYTNNIVIIFLFFAVTRPYGDINIEYGTKPLRIMCILDPELVREKYPGKTSADLYFLRNLDLIDKKYITIMNETAILLEIKNLEPSKDLYTCGLRTTNDEKIHKVAVCLNEVAIGRKSSSLHRADYMHVYKLFTAYIFIFHFIMKISSAAFNTIHIK